MNTFTLLSSAAGGVLVGLAAAMLLYFNGKVAGISGIAGGLVAPPARGDVGWRVAFLAGLVLAGVVGSSVAPTQFAFTLERSTEAILVAGLLVGFGTRLGGGCTSGHGVCGVSRWSKRSLLATATFIFAGAVVVFVTRRLLGGTL